MAGKKGEKHSHYAAELKREAVRRYLEEGQPQAEIVEALGIQNVRRLKQWLHTYRLEGEKAFEPKPRTGPVGRPPKRENTAAYIARLEMENDLLKKLHAELRRLELERRNIGSSTTKKTGTK